MKENSCEITPDIANPNNGSDVHQTTAIKIRKRKRVLKSNMYLDDEGYMGKFVYSSHLNAPQFCHHCLQSGLGVREK